MPNTLDITLKSGSNGRNEISSRFPPQIRKLTDDQIQKLLAEIAALKVPMTGLDGIVGCDGATYTLTIVSGFQEASFKWWCEPPAGWEGLARIASIMESLLPTPVGKGW